MKQLKLDLISYSDLHFYDCMTLYFDNKITYKKFLYLIGY